MLCYRPLKGSQRPLATNHIVPFNIQEVVAAFKICYYDELVLSVYVIGSFCVMVVPLILSKRV